MDKDTIQQIRDWAEAAANRLPYGKDNVVFSGVEIMELLDYLASKEAEVDAQREELERLRGALTLIKGWTGKDLNRTKGSDIRRFVAQLYAFTCENLEY